MTVKTDEPHKAALHVAFCGPVSLRLLNDKLDLSTDLPEGYECPLMSYLIRALLGAGVQMTVITSCCDIERQYEWYGDNLKIVATPRRKHYLYCLDAYRQEIRLMSQAIIDARPDIVHANWAYEFAEAALRTKRPCLVTSHDSPWTITKVNGHWYRYYRAIYASLFVIPRIKNISFVSPYLKDEFNKHHRESRNYWIVPNGISKDFINMSTVLNANRKDSPKYIAVSAWDPRKNPKALLRAFSLVKNKIPTAHLSIFGSGFQRGGPGYAWAENEGLSQGVSFCGCIPHAEVLSQLALADVCVHTTLEESFCMVVLEAMAQGVPCVGGRESGGVPWLLDDGNAGLVVDVRSPEAVAEAMVRLVCEPETCQSVAAKGLARVKEHFTLEAVAKQYVAVYEEILRDTTAHRVS